jgi:hypothetical protein
VLEGDSDDDEEEEIKTLTTAEFMEGAQLAGFSVEELLQAEAELHDDNKVGRSPGINEFHCPRASKIIKESARDKALRHKMKPWKGPLPMPRISPP